MATSTDDVAHCLAGLLGALSGAARRRGLTDSAWAAAAGLPKETLSRLRHRRDCDLSTLYALARAVDARITADTAQQPPTSPDGLMPASVHRDYEEQLLELAVAPLPDVQRWRALGPAFFMAGLAMLLASLPGFDRRRFIALAEQLHPGSSQPGTFELWLRRGALRADRFIPLLEQRRRHAA